jgi:hypothetical protein
MFKYTFKGIVQDKMGYQSDHLDFLNSRRCISGNFKGKSFFKLNNTAPAFRAKNVTSVLMWRYLNL